MRARRGVWRPPWLPLLVVGLCSAAQQRHGQQYPPTHTLQHTGVPRNTPTHTLQHTGVPRTSEPRTSTELRRGDGSWEDDYSANSQEFYTEELFQKPLVTSTSSATIGSVDWDEKENNVEPNKDLRNRDRLSSRDLVLPYHLPRNKPQPATRLNMTGIEKPSLFSGLPELQEDSNKPKRSYSNRIEGSLYPWRHSSSTSRNRGSLTLGSYLKSNILKEPSRQGSGAYQGVPNYRPLRSTSHLSRVNNNIVGQTHSISGNLNEINEASQPLGYIQFARREITAAKFYPFRNDKIPPRERKPSLFDPIIAQLKKEAEEAKRLNTSNTSEENSVYEAESNEKPGNTPWLQTSASGINYNQWHQVSTSSTGNNQVKVSNVGRNHWHQSSTTSVVGDQWQQVPSSSINSNQWHQSVASGISNNQWHLVTTTGTHGPLKGSEVGRTQHKEQQPSLFYQLGTSGGNVHDQNFPTQLQEQLREYGRPQPSFLEGSSSELLSSFGSILSQNVQGWSVASNWTFSNVPITQKTLSTNSSSSILRQSQRANEVFPLLEGLPLPARAAPLLEEQDPEVSPGLFQGDIALHSPEDVARFRVGVNWDVFPHLRWPNATVPYVISTLYLPEEHQMIQTSIATLNFLSCVRFVPWDGVAEDYLLIWPVEAPKGCWSYVGRRGGQQVVSLQRPDAASTRCFGSLGKPLHELLHALGVFHEHTRADRDDYVHVLVNNIVPEFLNNFQKQSLVNTTYAFDYDYDSVMHYGSHFFSKNGVDPTIRPLNPLAHIGQREMISKRDCLKLNALYSCLEPGTDQLDMYTAFCNTLAL